MHHLKGSVSPCAILLATVGLTWRITSTLEEMDALPALPLDRNLGAFGPNGAWLSPLPLPQMPARWEQGPTPIPLLTFRR